jgi:sigma-B regulation protein RsbU (phosphoserine phosphatase)
MPPGQVLSYVNRQLACRYTTQSDTFVTAFYGIYDPSQRQITYARAGHTPPRLKRCADGSLASLDDVGGLPLGISAGETYRESSLQLVPGDQVVFFTDGVPEARNPAGEMFGQERLDEVLSECSLVASALLGVVLEAIERFTEGRPADDDRTLLVARIS